MVPIGKPLKVEFGNGNVINLEPGNFVMLVCHRCGDPLTFPRKENKNNQLCSRCKGGEIEC